MGYLKHLIRNWRVACHAIKDVFAHFIHGILPFIKIRHHSSVEKRPR